ncbi:putative C2H2 finger domain protein [Aspergillus campestris IBT 28561]|uniref:C2H2 finger domain protein n=1 Tax=Aspergillus campestris (strain IBT 28561) TaxID=1392248 RepID=A0A2I1CYU8_ASPC2|nr:putative C2H2 finger domain protein [Aspergillus campestris IBT 28561]PKY02807.1 putative C2H2 finger domain protein [Aspergillus campestris IBT 28561]
MAPGSGRDFNCSWEHCGKSFNRKSDLCRHYRIHTNERPYHCTVKDCNKSFIQRSALTVHSRTHTGEKPHVCDHEGCHKAFSDSSSLARHRRIHTGKRPYICQEPACERSFCRKTTLTKHQHRSHPPGTITRPSSEDATSEHSYHPPTAVSIPNDQYLLAQQPYYPHASTPNHEYYRQQNVPMTPVAVHEPPIVTQNVPVTSPVDVHAQQQYMLMQQRYDQTRPDFVPPDYQQPFQGIPMVDGHPLMPSYQPGFQYKSQTRILNQPEGTDWGFLGVG